MLSKFRTKLLCLLLSLAGQISYAQPEAFLSGPEQIRPGHGTGLVLTIYRNGITGPIRFVQKIPKGWQAGPLPVFNADMQVVENQIQITWLQIPLNDTIQIAYELHVPKTENIGQTYLLDAQLQYFENNNRKAIAVRPQVLKIVKFFSRFQ
ncbi:MAG: hypothetical protein IT240_02835 [Bacteroidia bacterium]|nr:hypothetical protein [Bacteroidia bacterium]MCC6767956.1 hypothetical protein [Bacteroidia bacterium]